MLALGLLVMSACHSATITEVQLDYGLPDAISDESASEVRLYSPWQRPVMEWPADAPRTFHYIERDLSITFVLGREMNRGPLDPEWTRYIKEIASGDVTHIMSEK